MNRTIVVLLAAFDAVLAAAAGIAAALAPLTLLWVFGLGADADWAALWPSAVRIWEVGNLVPVTIALPDAYLAATGIPVEQGRFVLSLAPLAFAAFTAVFAARSGARSSRAEAWITGVAAGGITFAVAATAAALTAHTPIATVELWQAILFPTLLFAVPMAIGALVTEWKEAGEGAVARFRDRLEKAQGGWGEVVGLGAQGAAVALLGLLGAGALLVAVAVILRGGRLISLFEAGNLDLLGVIVVALGQFAYLPTLVIWGASYLAGPGFALGADATVAPVGSTAGVVPGIPVLGAIPEFSSPWLLLLALVPVGVGAFAGWVARSRFAAAAKDAATASGRPLEPGGPRAAVAGIIAVVSAGVAALAAWLASGSLGPGRLDVVGPQPGAVALAVGVEVFVGAAILLLSPMPEPRQRREKAPVVAASLTDAAVAEASGAAISVPAASAAAVLAGPIAGERLDGVDDARAEIDRAYAAAAADAGVAADADDTAGADEVDRDAATGPSPVVDTGPTPVIRSRPQPLPPAERPDPPR